MNHEEMNTSPGLNMEHGFVRKIEHTQHLRQQQVKEDAVRRQETAKLARKVGLPNKSLKPTMEIYRPPSVRMSGEFTNISSKQCCATGESGKMNDSHTLNLVSTTPETVYKNGNKVHFQAGTNKASAVDLKSALKRSKSFGGADLMEVTVVGFDWDTFPHEYQGMLRRAMHDPNSLQSHQLMELVRVICGKAVESVQNAGPAAQICFTIIEKERGNTFLESLLNSCREWYNERDKLLRSPFTLSSNCAGRGIGVVGPWRWTAYIAFLTGLYQRLKSQHHSTILAMQASGVGGTLAPAVADQTLTLLMLLYECCQIILKSPSLNNVTEIECLRSVLTTVGRQLETDSPQRMRQLMSLARDAFINPSISDQIRKTLLELVELHAGGWQLDLPQSMYYFPYTSVDRK